MKGPDVGWGTKEVPPVCLPGYIHIQANILKAGQAPWLHASRLLGQTLAPWKDHRIMLCSKQKDKGLHIKMAQNLSSSGQF